jgi:hypothetical protein
VEYQKQRYAKPEVRGRKKERDKQRNADPEVKERKKEQRKQRNADPEVKAREKEYNKRYRADPEVREHMKEQRKQRRADPEVKAREKEYDKQHYANPEVKERKKEQDKQRNAKPEVKECKRQRVKQRRATDSLFKLTGNLRRSIHESLRRGGYTKRAKTTKILGADFETVQHHLGPVPTYEYHIDHICPVAQAQNEEEAIKLCYYTNLRYLSAEENLQKSDKKTLDGEEMCRKLLGREWVD